MSEGRSVGRNPRREGGRRVMRCYCESHSAWWYAALRARGWINGWLGRRPVARREQSAGMGPQRHAWDEDPL